MPLWMQLLRDLAEPPKQWFGRPPRVRAIATGATLAGHDQAGAVPWCASAAWVAVELRPSRRGGRVGFTLAGVSSQSMAPSEFLTQDGVLRLLFRFPPPKSECVAMLCWRGRVIARMPLRTVSEAHYRARLVVQTGITVQLGPHTVAATAVVARQCRRAITALTLMHPDGLLPLRQLGVQREVISPATLPLTRRVQLDPAQLTGNSLTVATLLPRMGLGRRIITWTVGEQVVAQQTLLGLTVGRFRRQIRVVDSGFVVASATTSESVRHPPPRWGGAIGPRFALAGQPGWVGIVPYCVLTVGGNGQEWRGRSLVLGEPTELPLGFVEPGTALTGFELFLGKVQVGSAVARPVPSATFTAEGKFTPPADFPWTRAADDELLDRLDRLG